MAEKKIIIKRIMMMKKDTIRAIIIKKVTMMKKDIIRTKNIINNSTV